MFLYTRWPNPINLKLEFLKKPKKYAKKKYYITVCEEVPGMIYQMSTVVPSESGSDPLMEETLTFEKVLN